jgi:hypothetical protein
MAKNDAEGFSKELLDQLLPRRDPKTVLDSVGLVGDLKKALAERMLNAEMDVTPLRPGAMLFFLCTCVALAFSALAIVGDARHQAGAAGDRDPGRPLARAHAIRRAIPSA